MAAPILALHTLDAFYTYATAHSGPKDTVKFLRAGSKMWVAYGAILLQERRYYSTASLASLHLSTEFNGKPFIRDVRYDPINSVQYFPLADNEIEIVMESGAAVRRIFRMRRLTLTERMKTAVDILRDR